MTGTAARPISRAAARRAADTHSFKGLQQIIMFGAIARKIFGTANDRIIKDFRKSAEKINANEAELEKLSDEELRTRTEMLRQKLADSTPLYKLLPEAFATVREAAKRTLGQRHFDVQMIGGMVLHNGMIAEMATGEGKTLVATLPVYLNALEGKGVHVVTVNDYLAQRDAAWMGKIYEFLGLTVGCIVHGLDDEERRRQYGADVTYGTNNEFGFDYLRDNMKYSLDSMVQRAFNYAIVDEVDSILIDEARTPLIISGPTEDNFELYRKIDRFIPPLDNEDFEKDEKARAVSLTDAGAEKIEKSLHEANMLKGKNLYDIENISVVHHVNQALRAHKLFSRDTDYIIKNDKVIIIDEFTGRMMEGRRYSEGLHQALEAKEGVQIQNENQTLASITFQNYFRLYPKLAGMTGTAATEAAEFGDIYKLDVVQVPTNLPCVRDDNDDEVYRTSEEKMDAVVALIRERHEAGQPLLVGTVSIEKSEVLSKLLDKQKVRHKVLNARFHEQEAFIIAQAGQPGAVTIATNMAGRGTDIQLGGNLEMRVAQELEKVTDAAEHTRRIDQITAEIEANKAKVIDAGGLYVVATERHESRRIDNQLRGRSGRQGDPGASKFYLSLEDDLMRIFGSERMDGMLQKLGLEKGEAIVHNWINKAIAKAQQKVEARNFEIRKNLLKFDDVMNDQRKVIYEQRVELMSTEDVAETISDMRHEIINDLVTAYIPAKSYHEQWEVGALREECRRVLAIDVPIADWAKEEGIADEEIRERVTEASDRKVAERVARFGPELMRLAEKSLLLQILDQHWKDHLLSLDHLRQGISLRAYAQKDPLNEYKREAFSMFDGMLNQLRDNVTSVLSHIELRREAPESAYEPKGPREMHESHADPMAPEEGRSAQAARPVTTRIPAARRDTRDPSTWGKVGRNEPCPCESGKKFKHCHGKI